MKNRLIIFFILVSVVFIGCASVAVPKVQSITHIKPTTFTIKPYATKIEYQGIDKKVKMPQVGNTNAFGVTITPELQIAYDSYLSGDGEKALDALNIAHSMTKDPLTLWQISFLKTQAYMLMGRDADAQEEIKQCEKYEKVHFNHNLNSMALRGEIYLMEDEFDKARADFNNILITIGDWELPTSYGLPPSNIDELVSITTAQLRSYTGIAASYVMQDNYKKALVWAKESELRFNSVHYISNHSLYGMFFQSHLDSYYGRAMNMTMLACAILGTSKDINEANKYYEKALGFFKAINYQKGEIITLALKAKTLSAIGRYDDANKVALEAIAVANQKKMYDFIWRIETLRGIYLLKKDKIYEAQTAFRNASNVIDLVSGDLQTDFAKRRFDIGKDELVYNLMMIDIALKNYKQLFKDVEQGRARAFVDVMKNRTILEDKNSKLLKKIRQIDKDIKKLVIENNSLDGINNIQAQEVLRFERKKTIKKLIKSEPKSASIVSSFSYELSDIQSSLNDNKTILYFLPVKKDEKIKALLITKNNIKLKTFNITQVQLSNIMQQFLTKIGASENSLTQEMRSFKKKAKQNTAQTATIIKSPLDKLHKLLPLDSIKTKKLYIVGSGSTTYIPWATYNNSLEISILPNANWLLNTTKKSNYKNVVIVGNPNYGGELPQLSGTTKEAQALSKLYNTKPLLYKNATLENINKSIGSGAQILHLATHGVFYSDKPLESAIFLTKDSKLYTLSAKDIFKSPLKADLVILSACETGMGANVAGNDLLGLPRSFFLGGTKAILSSLWPIDDEGTKEFMIQFHKYAKNGEYTKGLVQAKKYLKSKGYGASVYGAFVLYGTSIE